MGTAGHVDHGKSSLVRALTGTDPDRWREEQLRGMTLDLGFAHLRFDDGVEAGIVDVPGHERFLHNMLAGAAGMEVLLLIVAANEGPRPQTLEHLAILNYLNVRRSIIVLTKRDLVDADELSFVEELTRETVRGSIAADAPAVAVSATTGEGMEALRAAIHEALLAIPKRAPDAPAFLPVDRVFALSGHGTVVTGTLMQGSIAVGQTLRLQPSGRDVRVRSLHVFGTPRDRVEGGARVAANLPGVDVAEIGRGEVLAAPEFEPQRQFAVTFTPLASALPLLRRRNPVRAYIGSAEVLGTLIFDVAPQARAALAGTLMLRRAAASYPGEAFVVRRLSPKDVLGGGVIGVGQEEEHVDRSPEETAILAVLADIGMAATTPGTISARANVREERAAGILEQLVERGTARKLNKPVAFIDGAVSEMLFSRAVERVRAAHAEMPWLMGVTSLGLAKATAVAEPLLQRILATFVDEGRLEYRQGYYAAPGFAPELSSAQRTFFDGLIPIDAAQPLLPATAESVTQALRSTKIPGASQAFDTLLATGGLVKVHDAVYRGSQIADARARLEAALRREGSLTMAQFRDALSTSRKYAVPLMEYFDAVGVTIRNGDVRVLRELPVR